MNYLNSCSKICLVTDECPKKLVVESHVGQRRAILFPGNYTFVVQEVVLLFACNRMKP